MPRKARIDEPGALHHIIIRGIERNKIFYDHSDRDNFLVRARPVKDLKAMDSYAYSGHSMLMGKRKCDWQDSKSILTYFGESRGVISSN